MDWILQRMEYSSIKTEEDAESHFSLLPQVFSADSRCLQLRIESEQSGGDAEGVQLGACRGCERRLLVS